MRKMISFAVVALLASSLSAQTVANMKDLNAEKKSAAINLKLTGTLTTTRNSDFRQLRDLVLAIENSGLERGYLSCSSKECLSFPSSSAEYHPAKPVAGDWYVRLSLPATICRKW